MTLPTRVTDRSATLIDNIFSNVSDNRQHFSGILITNLSDHFPRFYQIKTNRRYNKSNKFIFCRNFNQENIYKLYHNLESRDIYILMDTDENADPNYNNNILENILITALNKYIPLQKVKFNKYKQKKCNWITTGILKSIKFRDNLYRRLKHTEINTEEYNYDFKEKFIILLEKLSLTFVKENLKIIGQIPNRHGKLSMRL